MPQNSCNSADGRSPNIFGPAPAFGRPSQLRRAWPLRLRRYTVVVCLVLRSHMNPYPPQRGSWTGMAARLPPPALPLPVNECPLSHPRSAPSVEIIFPAHSFPRISIFVAVAPPLSPHTHTGIAPSPRPLPGSAIDPLSLLHPAPAPCSCIPLTHPVPVPCIQPTHPAQAPCFLCILASTHANGTKFHSM